MNVATALKKGVLVRPSVCSECKKPCKPDAHHDNYRFSLGVRWLCRTCHRRWHGINGSAPNRPMRSKPQLNISMDAGIYDAMKDVARREFRPVGRQIELALREWLALRDASPSPLGRTPVAVEGQKE